MVASADLPLPNDGTVAVDETLLPGAVAHRIYDASHIGMLFSRTVADSTCYFLANGSFEPDGA